jgi:hypothetical protein
MMPGFLRDGPGFGGRARRGPLLAVALAMLLPSTAFADVGTPLMWASMFHLAIGNAVIGVAEGLLVAWLFKAPPRRAVLTLIAANYVSAWAGTFLLGLSDHGPDVTIENLRGWFVVFVLLAFLATLLIEYPFFWFVLRGQGRPVVRAAKATVVVNAMSYVVLLAWYWAASGTSMMTRLTVCPVAELSPPETGALYFLTPDGGRIVRTDLQGQHREPVRTVAVGSSDDRLYARKEADGSFSLYLHRSVEGDSKGREELIARGFARKVPVDWDTRVLPDDRVEGTWLNTGPVPTLAVGSAWEDRVGFWAVEGISGENKADGRKFRFSLETPFAYWPVRNATQIEGDMVVFQLGRNQICLLDPATRRIALIARGQGPIVVEP